MKTITLKIRYAERDILQNNPRVVNIVYYVEETGVLFGFAYHMDNPEDRAFIKKLMEVLNAATLHDMVDRDIQAA